MNKSPEVLKDVKLEYVQKEQDYRKNGVVYTPKILANYVAKKTLQYILSDKKSKLGNKLTIIDPACGDGVLLVSLVKELLNSSKFSNKKIVLSGIDTDKNALISCKEQLIQELPDNASIKFWNTNALCPLNGHHLVGWDEILQKTTGENGFDVVIANPPWGADISDYKEKIDLEDFKTLRGQVDSFELFMELALNILNNGGYYSFIVPDSILNHGKSILRKLLLEKTQILFIARLGEKIFPGINRGCIVIIGRNKRPETNSMVDCFRLNPSHRKKILRGELSFEDAERLTYHKVPQKRFETNKNQTLNIDLKETDAELLKKFTVNKITLGSFLTNARGVELGGSGEICRCPNCKMWSPHPQENVATCNHCKKSYIVEKSLSETIIKDRREKGTVPLINGYDIQRYLSKPSKWIAIQRNGINYKNQHTYRGPKILVRKTGVGITAALDYSNSYTTQVVYIFKKKEDEDKIGLEFFIALINSRAYYFYLTKNFGEIEWKSHPYLTQNQILDLPIPNIKSKESLEIIEKISSLIRPYLKKQQVIPKVVDSEVEKMIGRLFGLGFKDYKIIYEGLEQSEDLVPIQALRSLSIQELF